MQKAYHSLVQLETLGAGVALAHVTRYGVPLIRYVGVLCYVSDRKQKKGELRIPPQLKLILPFYGLLRGVRWF